MAAMIASKGAAPMAKLLEKLVLNPARVLVASYQSAVRSFNTNAQMREVNEDESAGALDVDRRGDDRLSRRRRMDVVDYPFFSGRLFDPFNPTRSLSQVLNLMDKMMDAPFLASARGMAGGARRTWDAKSSSNGEMGWRCSKEDKDALHLRVDMPGLGKEHVRVSAEQNSLMIKGEGEGEGEKESEEEEEEAGRRYSSRIDLPEGLYKMDQIKAEMKNGVLKVTVKVTVPKAKEEERRDVFQVQIE